MSDATVIDLKDMEGIDSILLIRLFALGDIVLTLPLIRQFRESFPGAWIGCLVKERFSEALAGDTGLDEVLPLPDGAAGQVETVRRIRKRRPDVAIDLLSSPRSALITRFCGARLKVGMDTGRRNGYYDEVLPRTIIRDGKRIRCYTIESNLELCRMLGLPEGEEGHGIDSGDEPYGFPAAAEGSQWASSFIGSLGETDRDLAGIVPGSTYPSKAWPLDRFIELAGRISGGLGIRPVIMWGPGEEELAKRIAREVPGAIVPPATGVAEAGALIGRMKVLVGIDSGPKHVAVLLGVPTVTLFGPTDPRIWDPVNSLHRVIWKGLDCAEGCRDKECEPNRCMDMISVDEVFSEVRDVIGGEA